MLTRSPDRAVLRRITRGSSGTARSTGAVVLLLLHGGEDGPKGRSVPPWWPPVLGMWRFVPMLRGAADRPVIYLLRNAVRGWNHGTFPIRDARWALAEIRRRHQGRPIVLIGHSMGGRVGVAVLTEPAVIGLVGLAPWLPRGEPIPELDGRRLVLLHGSADTQISPADTRAWVQRAAQQATGQHTESVEYQEIPGGDHPMIRRFRQFSRLSGLAVHSMLPGLR